MDDLFFPQEMVASAYLLYCLVSGEIEGGETRREKQKLNLLCVYIYIVLLAELCCDVHLFFFIFFIRLEKNM